LPRTSLAPLALLLCLCPAAGARADDGAPAVDIHALNQLEYSVNTDEGRNPAKPKEILEEWLDVDVRFERALIGFRYEAFQPHELRADSAREGIVQRYAAFDWENGSIRVGNFYEIFGRGLLFRSYEDRAIRIDSNMEGVLLTGRVARLAGKAFSGRIREVETDRRTDVLRGADLEGDVGGGARVGASYLILSSEAPGTAGAAEPRHEEVVGGRASFARDWFDASVEAGRINRLYIRPEDLIPTPSRPNPRTYDDLRGTGFYGSLGLYPLSGVAVTAEYKDYDEFRFQPVNSSGTDYNNPPALTRETSYTLLSRHPHILSPNDEKGFQVEAVVTPSPGTTITLNRSETNEQDGDLAFHEWFAEVRRPIGERVEAALVYDFIEDAESETKNRTPVIEIEYHPEGERSLRGEYQFQDTETARLGKSSTHFALVECHVNLDLTFSVVGEHAGFLDPVSREGAKDDFVYAQADYHLTPNHFLSVTVGKRRAGYICVGGICRFEPEFEGVEARFVTSF